MAPYAVLCAQTTALGIYVSGPMRPMLEQYVERDDISELTDEARAMIMRYGDALKALEMLLLHTMRAECPAVKTNLDAMVLSPATQLKLSHTFAELMDSHPPMQPGDALMDAHPSARNRRVRDLATKCVELFMISEAGEQLDTLVDGA